MAFKEVRLQLLFLQRLLTHGAEVIGLGTGLGQDLKACLQFAHLIRLSDEEIRVSLQMGGLGGCRRGGGAHQLRPGTRCHSLKTSFVFQSNIWMCCAGPMSGAVHFSAIRVIPNSVNVSG